MMADRPPPAYDSEGNPVARGSSNPRMLSAMDSLTQELRRLNDHMRNADDAAVRRGRQAANDQSVAARSQGPATPTGQIPQAWSARAADFSSQDRIQATMSASSAMDALEQQRQRTNTGESTPPGIPASGGESEPTNINQPSAAEALTWAMLGEHGGPFGRLRMQQFMLQRNIGWAQNAASTTQGAMQDFLDVRALNDPNVQAGGSPSLWNRLGQAGAAGLDPLNRALSWAQTPRGEWSTLAGLGAYRMATHAFNAMTDWRDAGRALGYGNQQDLGFAGFNNPFRQLGAAGQGLSLKMEEWALEGRMPGLLGGPSFLPNMGGMTSAQAKAAVGTLAAQGFSNEGGYSNYISGDNYRIAQNLMRPLMNMGLTAADAAQWTPALRNANTSMQTLLDTLSNLPKAAQAAKMTVADFNASLEQTAQASVSQGGTLQGGAQMGMAFTEATGMAPALGSTLSRNPIYTALMMGQFGVLPSGVANLPGGAQVQGMLSAFNLLRGATAGLNQNKYETVAGRRLPTAFGYQLQDAQIAQMLGVDQSTINRLRREAPFASRIAGVLGQLGNEGSNGLAGTGIWSILGRGQDWGHLTSADRQQATAVWNATAGRNIHNLGLTNAQIKDLYGTTDIRKRVDTLQKDLLGQQQKSPENHITVYVKFKGAASRMLQQAGPSSIKIMGNSGGSMPNSVYNTPLGDAVVANPNQALFSGPNSSPDQGTYSVGTMSPQAYGSG